MQKKWLFTSLLVLIVCFRSEAQNIDWTWWPEEDSVGLGIPCTDDSLNFLVPFSVTHNRDVKLFGKTVSTGSLTAGNKTGIVKIDSLGNYIWSLAISTGVSLQSFSVNQVIEKDGYYYALGGGNGNLKFYLENKLIYTYDVSNYTRPYLFIKIGPDGYVHWIRKLYQSKVTKTPPLVSVLSYNLTTDNNAIALASMGYHHDSLYIETDSVNTISQYITGFACGSTSQNILQDFITYYDSNGVLDTVLTGLPDLRILPVYGSINTNMVSISSVCDSATALGWTFYKNEGFIFRPDINYSLKPMMRLTRNAYGPRVGLGLWRSFAGFWSSFINIADSTLYSYSDSTLYTLDGGEFLIFDKDLKLLRRKKVFHFDQADSINFLTRLTLVDSTIFYLYGEGDNYSLSQKNILVNGIPYTIPARQANRQFSRFNFLIKMDEFHNVLWIRLSYDTSGIHSYLTTVSSMLVDKKSNLLFLGTNAPYAKSVFFGDTIPYQDYRYPFLVKLRDENITRGYVYPGPYCAGDSITIPYTCEGKFSGANYFIAQMSDEYGNFEDTSKTIELGRLKQTAGDTIKGILPLYQLNTSAAYRIRIISTSPPIQSYYKRDTLRLLIYSKDTANAGPDLAICKSQSIQLDTRGGSRWHWSPANKLVNPADSVKRNPFVNPMDTTEFRIIISDSSGCGVTDTDFVKVNVRPYITHSFIADTQVCKGYTQTLKSLAVGGDSTRYWYKWRERTSLTTISTTDSLVISPVKTTIYIVTVGDSCSNKIKADTITIHVDTVLTALTSPDTTICRGSSATVQAYGSGCNPKYYKYEWTEKGKPGVLGTTATLTVSPATTTEYQVLLKDTSTLLQDTAIVKVTVDNVFKLTLTKDSTICTGQSLVLQSGIISCDTSQMHYTWDNGLGTGSAKVVSPTTTTIYTVIGENKFNGLKDTARVTVTVRPPLSITLNSDTTICIGETAELRATTSGGDMPNHSVVWSEIGVGSTVNGQQTTVSPAKTTTYRAFLTDGCTVEGDSAEITVTARPPLKVTVNADTAICIGQAAELRATLSGGYVPSHSLLWTAVGGPWTNNSPTATVSPTVTTTYKALLTDNCTTPGDSAELTVTVRPPLKVTVNADTTICVGETAELRATITGGYVSNHSIVWSEVGGLWTSNSPTVTVNATTTTTYRAVLTDNCTTPADSAEVKITVRPPLQIAISAKDSICANQQVILTVSLSGGYTPGHAILLTSDHGLLTNQNPATDLPQNTTTYIARLSDNCSPDAYDTATVIVVPAVVADFSLQPNEGCPPLTVTLTDLSTGHDTLLNVWKVQGANVDGISQLAHEFVTTGKYTIGLTVANSLGCADTKTEVNAVTVFEKPTAQFIVKPEIKEVESPLYLYHQSSRATKYTWDFGDGNYIYQNNNNDTFYTYNEPGDATIRLIAENEKGCLDTQTQNIRVFDRINCVIPNAFTPNNRDDLNPVFAPVCSGDATYEMTIFNRWGQVIQHCENCAWDGTFADKPVPAGVYLYKLIITGESKKKATSFGSVNVVR